MEFWEYECHTLNLCCRIRALSRRRERRAIENLPEQAGLTTRSGPQRSQLASKKGLITADELERSSLRTTCRRARRRHRNSRSARWCGCDERRRASWRRPHLRTPATSLAPLALSSATGAFNDPSLLAYGATPERQHLYRVRHKGRVARGRGRVTRRARCGDLRVVAGGGRKRRQRGRGALHLCRPCKRRGACPPAQPRLRRCGS